jgi:hypothetical protein
MLQRSLRILCGLCVEPFYETGSCARWTIFATCSLPVT